MKKFNIGDRIAVYLGKHRHVASVEQIKEGMIYFTPELLAKKLDPNDTGVYIFANPKQCRLLKKKPRRRLHALIPSYSVNGISAYFDKHSLAYNQKLLGYRGDVSEVEFVEVVRRPKT